MLLLGWIAYLIPAAAEQRSKGCPGGLLVGKKLEPAIGLHFPYECVTECAQRTNFLVVSADTTVRIQKIRKFLLSYEFFLDSYRLTESIRTIYWYICVRT